MLKRFKRLSRSSQIGVLAVLAVTLVFGFTGGCGAYRRPPALSAEERSLLDTGPLPYSVTVAWWDEQTDPGFDDEAYNGSLAKLLEASDTFESTRYERSSIPTGQDLIATSTGAHCNSAMIPIFTGISLGIIPTIWQEAHCEGMLLRRGAGQPKTDGVEVSLQFKGTAVMGWVAVPLGFLPGWAHGAVEDDSRFIQRFRLATIHKRTDIERLVTR